MGSTIVTRKPHLDASERMKRAHEAAAYDEWFREEVAQALVEADDPATQWVSHDEVKLDWAKQRAELLKSAEGTAA